MSEQIIIDIINQCEFDLFELEEDDFDMMEIALDADDIPETLTKFKCVIKSIEDAVKGSKIVKVTSQWEVTQKFLEILFNRINACKNIEDASEQTE